jgi:co-chaperonin GroES (HSP10)
MQGTDTFVGGAVARRTPEQESAHRLADARARMAAHQERWTPCGDRLVAMELPRDEAKVGRIVLSDAERDKGMLTRTCEVLAVGPACADFGVGDQIMVGMYAGKMASFSPRDTVLVLTPDEVLQRISAAELEQQAAEAALARGETHP